MLHDYMVCYHVVHTPYYLDSVTVILTAPSLQMYVMSRAVTEQIVTQSRRLVEFSVSKWLKLTLFHLFTPLFG